MPRKRTVLSSLLWPSKSCTARNFFVRRRSCTTSHARSWLSMPRLKRARSRKRPWSCKRTRIAQISLSLKGVFCPTSLPLFHGDLGWPATVRSGPFAHGPRRCPSRKEGPTSAPLFYPCSLRSPEPCAPFLRKLGRATDSDKQATTPATRSSIQVAPLDCSIGAELRNETSPCTHYRAAPRAEGDLRGLTVRSPRCSF
jgi:hypothetical protein